MRIIEQKIYKFDELSKEAQEKAVIDHTNFEIEVMDENSPYWEHALDMEKMKTPWFLGEVLFEKEYESIAETIKVNEYEFTKDGSFYYETTKAN